jgi:predicted nucleic acid-binding protein
MISPRIVFVDASAWIAIMSKKDGRHETAAQIYERELRKSTYLITSNLTTYEAYTKIKTEKGIEIATKLRDVIENKRLVKIERVTSDIEEEALEIFWRYHDKTWGIIDITSFVIMDRNGCNSAFAFDRHFVEAAQQKGFHLLTVDAEIS